MESLGAYIPKDRRHALAQAQTLPSRAQGAVLFADISGFTPLTEALVKTLGARRGAEVLPQKLNSVYDALIGEVNRYGGSVIGFSGDAITCWFDGDDGTCATTCALAMQVRMETFSQVPVPGGDVITLALKVAVASGSVRRFLVGDPAVQLLDVIAGETLGRVAAAEGLAHKGEVVLDALTAQALRGTLELAEWRGSGTCVAVVQGLRAPAPPVSPAPLAPLSEAQLRPWLLPAVYKRLQSGQAAFLTELRPAVALFLRFSGIDYDEDEDAGEKLDVFIRWVQNVLSRYEGTLIQLTFGDKGSFLYAAFGAPIAHEDDVRRAALAALEFKRPKVDFISSIQIGLSQGTMRSGAYGGSTRLTYGVLGDEVNLAARLMAQAARGQVVASGRIYETLQDDFLWQSLGTVKVKGKSEPLPIYELVAANRQVLGLQEPSYSLTMVGRAEELSSIEAKMAQVLAGRGQIAGITAEAGMGKSRLVVEVLQLAKHKFVSYGGACQSYGTNIPYLVWQPIWWSFFGLEPNDTLEHQIATLRAYLEGIDPSLLPRLPLLGAVLNLPIADNDLTRSFEPQLRKASLEALLVDCLRAQANTPLLLVLEDLQWLDPLSQDLLDVVSRAIVSMPVLVLLAYRPLDPSRLQAPPFMALAHFSEIRLHEFTLQETESLIRLKLAAEASDVPPQLVKQLSERAQGNPFYVEELLNFLQDSGIDPRQVWAWRKVELPSSLQSLILSRIDRLAEREKITLKVASIIGRLIRVDWLHGYYPELGTKEAIHGDLEMLRLSDLTMLESTEPELSYLIKHIMTREVAYESLAYATRALLHERLAGFLEGYMDVERNLDLLAYHFDKSDNLLKKKEYLRRAGEAAQRTYANEAAIDYFGRLLPLLEGPESIDIHLKLGEVKMLLGHYQEAEASYRAALALAERAADERALACGHRRMGELLEKQGDYAGALNWLAQAQQASQALADKDELVQVLLALGGNVYWQQGEYAAAKECLEEALKLTWEFDDLKNRARVLHGLGNVQLYQGNHDAAQKLFEESLALRRKTGDKLGIANALNNLGIVVYQRDISGARARFEESLAIRRDIGDKAGIAQALNNLGFMSSEQGDLKTAQVLYEESLTLRRELGDKLGIANALNNLGNLIYIQGDDSAAKKHYCESIAITHDIGNKREAAAALMGLAAVTAKAAISNRSGLDRAVRLAAAAEALLTSIGAAMEPELRSLQEAVLSAARAALDEATYTSAWEAGMVLGLEEAVPYALNGSY
jgi:adenylate cyclase